MILTKSEAKYNKGCHSVLIITSKNDPVVLFQTECPYIKSEIMTEDKKQGL